MEKHAVVSPLGIDVVERASGAPRLDRLDGKRIGEVWNGVFKGDLAFPAIRRRLAARYPGVEVVPYTEFPHAPGSDNPARQRELAREVARLAKERRCDAIVSGIGA
jgi:hypothetical protein